MIFKGEIMKLKSQFLNFRVESNLYDELVEISRAADLSCSAIARKGLRMILDDMKSNRPIWTSTPTGGNRSLDNRQNS